MRAMLPRPIVSRPAWTWRSRRRRHCRRSRSVLDDELLAGELAHPGAARCRDSVSVGAAGRKDVDVAHGLAGPVAALLSQAGHRPTQDESTGCQEYAATRRAVLDRSVVPLSCHLIFLPTARLGPCWNSSLPCSHEVSKSSGTSGKAPRGTSDHRASGPAACAAGARTWSLDHMSDGDSHRAPDPADAQPGRAVTQPETMPAGSLGATLSAGVARTIPFPAQVDLYPAKVLVRVPKRRPA